MSVADFDTNATACPGCSMASVAANRARGAVENSDQTILLSLPTIHCASCMSTIEQGLLAMPEVKDVRVNLTRKRATIHARPGTDAAEMANVVSRLGYEAQPLDQETLSADNSDRSSRDLLMRLGVAGFAMMNVMLLSVAVWSGAEAHTRDLFHWLSAAIALPAIAFAAQPFFRNAWNALRQGRLNMDVPISLAILLAAAMSLFETAQGGEHAYFDAALSLTFFLLAGRFLDQRTRRTARSAATELAALEAPTALRVLEGGNETVSIRDLCVGDVVMVRPGMRVPVDGIITRGASDLDRSLLTGETDPISVKSGDTVRAGEVNLNYPLEIRTTAVGKDTFLHSLADLVSVAEQAKSKYNSLANRAASFYAPAVHILALVAFVLWLYLTGGDVRHALNIAVATLIITCPCALGLAVPAVSTVASGAMFKKGLLIKHPTALERLAEVQHVVFDKTGTLTLGKPQVLKPQGIDPEYLAIAAGLAAGSMHPRSMAIVDAAETMGVIATSGITNVEEVPGVGIQGKLGKDRVRLGRADSETHTGTFLFINDDPVAAVNYADQLRPGAKEVIDILGKRGIPVSLFSGDTLEAVDKISIQLGINDARAGMLPKDKVDQIKALEDSGKRVLMVGDGLNDTAALSVAHVSIAPASALDAARVASDIVLVTKSLNPIEDALSIGTRAKRRILENFGIAAAYNAVAIPFAFLGFATPLTAAIAMSSSSIIVSLNALRTR